MLINNIVHVVPFYVALSLSACINDASADANTAREPTTLCGKLSLLRDHATLRCLDSNADGKVYARDCKGGRVSSWNITCGVVWGINGMHFHDQFRDTGRRPVRGQFGGG